MAAHRVFIALGSNRGDKRAHLQAALERLTASGEVVLAARSRLYATEPVGFRDPEWFLNAVVEVYTAIRPAELLERLKAIERALGRRESPERYAPRVIDLDILLYGREVVDLPDLKIPHPEMHRRRFVLFPLCDIAPDVVHPTLKQTARALCDALSPDGQEVRPER